MAPALQRTRLRGKQAPTDPRVKKDTNVIKQVYLVSVPDLREPVLRRLRQKTPARDPREPVLRRLRQKTPLALRSPGVYSREDIEKMFIDAAARPVYEDSRNQHHRGSVDLASMVIFLELHKLVPGASRRKPHYHVALQGKRSFRFLPMKRAIRARYGLETNWSCTHDGYWSAVRYGAVPSPGKPQNELDPAPRLWAKCGKHKPLKDVVKEPMTVAAIEARSYDRLMKASGEGKAEPRPTEMDLYAAIVSGNFKNTPDDQHAWKRLISHLKDTSTSLYSYAFKMRARLRGLIDDVWSWELVGDDLAVVSMSRIARLQHAASQPCECGGKWAEHAERIFYNNNLSPADFFTDVHRSLFRGRGPSTKVLVLTGRYGGEGKSFLYAPLRKVYGEENIQESPQPGNFALLGLEEKSLALLDEWRFDESVLRMATQLLWYEGKPFPVTRPQNQAGAIGHFLYRGSAPLFVTTKEEYLARILAAAKVAQQQKQPSQHTMLLRRLKVYTLCVPSPVEGDANIPECARCFACMSLRHSRDRRGIAQSKQAVPRAPKWKQPVFDYAAAGIDPNDI